MNKDKIQTLIEIEEDYGVPLGYVVINRDNWHELAVTGFKLLSENTRLTLENEKLRAERDEAREWAGKMMRERDEWSKIALEELLARVLNEAGLNER